MTRRLMGTLLSLAWLALTPQARAEEIWLYDNTRLHGLVRGVTAAGEIVVALPVGTEEKVPLENVVAILYLGRTPLLIQSGTQEFRLNAGGRLRGQVLGQRGDRVLVRTALAGEIEIDLAYIKGFVALPMIGFSGRKAEELVESNRDKLSAALDVVLDRRGSSYPGVLRKLERTEIQLDHEDLLQVVPIKV